MGALVRVGHKGADAIVAGNSLDSFDAALTAGVDMIEFDVIAVSTPRPELYVAHDHHRLQALADEGAAALTLTAALTHLTTPRYAGVRLQVDIKGSGYAERVLAALDHAGVVGRSFVSTTVWRNLVELRAQRPELQLGWTVPEIPGVSGTPLLTPTLGRLYGAVLPGRAAARIRAGEIDALVAHWRIVTARLVEEVVGAGGAIYAWTVDEPGEIRRLRELGVTGVITNDPRLFEKL
jgi:glycerophosphoryl diester phosphodiesterase